MLVDLLLILKTCMSSWNDVFGNRHKQSCATDLKRIKKKINSPNIGTDFMEFVQPAKFTITKRYINDKPESLSISLEAFRLLPMLDLLWCLICLISVHLYSPDPGSD